MIKLSALETAMYMAALLKDHTLEVRNTIIEASKMEDWHISRIFKD